MSIEVKVPALPESVSEATVATWHKAAGDAVKRDETLVELETDKVMLEVPAPADGTLGEIKHAEGASVTADTVLALIEEGGAAAAFADEREVMAAQRGHDDVLPPSTWHRALPIASASARCATRTAAVVRLLMTCLSRRQYAVQAQQATAHDQSEVSTHDQFHLSLNEKRWLTV